MSKDDMPSDIREQLEQDAAVYGNGYAEKLEDGTWRVIDPTKIRIFTNIVDYKPKYPLGKLSINMNGDQFPKLEELPKKTYHVDSLPRKGIAGTISFEKKLDDQLKMVVYEDDE